MDKDKKFKYSVPEEPPQTSGANDRLKPPQHSVDAAVNSNPRPKAPLSRRNRVPPLECQSSKDRSDNESPVEEVDSTHVEPPRPSRRKKDLSQAQTPDHRDEDARGKSRHRASDKNIEAWRLRSALEIRNFHLTSSDESAPRVTVPPQQLSRLSRAFSRHVNHAPHANNSDADDEDSLTNVVTQGLERVATIAHELEKLRHFLESHLAGGLRSPRLRLAATIRDHLASKNRGKAPAPANARLRARSSAPALRSNAKTPKAQT